MTEPTTTTITTFTIEQAQRVAALRVAAEVLRASTGGSVFTQAGHGGLPKHRTPTDLVDLAGWIVTGIDPLDKYTEQRKAEDPT